MKLTRIIPVLLVLLAGGALNAQSAALFAKTHPDLDEAKAAKEWYAKLPTWVAGVVKDPKRFIRTWLPLDDKFRASTTPGKFEIRDANARQFSAYVLVRNGIGSGMETEWAATKTFTWLDWGKWPAKYIITSYPVESSDDVKDLVAFSAWLFDQKEPDLANRVLTRAREMDRDLAPLIEGYLREKNKWQGTEPLVKWNLWDEEFRRERPILIPPELETARKTAREKEAAAAFADLLKARGDYEGKPPRRKPPTMMLIMVDWELKQFKTRFAASDFVKNEKNLEKLEKIANSIVDDQQRIKDGLEKAGGMTKDYGDQKGTTTRLNYMEAMLALDPENYQMRAQIGNEWYAFSRTDVYGNDCQNPEAAKKAIAHYKKLLDYFPQNLAYMLAMGKCYQALQDSTRAHPIYDKIIELDTPQGNYGQLAAGLKRNMEAKDKERQDKADNKNR